MIYEYWCSEEDFGLMLYRIREFITNNHIIDIRSFAAFPAFDDDTNEVIKWNSVLYYTKESK